MKECLSVFLIILLNSCVMAYPGERRLEKLCETHAKTEIKKSVYVDGYYDGYINSPSSAAVLLMSLGYEYIEFSNSDSIKGVGFDESGYYKIYKAKKGGKYCNLWLDRMFMKQIGLKSFYDNGGCISSVRQKKY